MTEQWVQLEEYPGVEISNHGNVRNIETGAHYTIRPNGSVSYILNRYQYDIRVGRTVLSAFDRLPEDKEYPVHLDGDKTNCHLANLRWGSVVETTYIQNGVTDSIIERIRVAFAEWRHDDYEDLLTRYNITKGQAISILNYTVFTAVCPELQPIIEQMKSRRRGSKLTPDDVEQIRRLHASNQFPHSRLSEMFGVSRSHIGRIVNRERWEDVR